LEPYSQADNCHVNAREKVRHDGGTVQHGWIIWEVPDWTVQLEFHSLWKNEEGNLVEVTPPVHRGNTVLFLPDPVSVYEGLNVPMIFYPYRDTAFCREYVALSDEIFRSIHPPGEPPGRREMPTALRMRLRAFFAMAQQIL
jgi:hypothetical protein